MYSDWVGPAPYGAGFLAVFVWLSILTFLVLKQGNFLKSLFPKSGERDVRKKFEEVIKTITNFRGELSELGDKLSQLEKQGLVHIQRVELLRYNPYDDTGGNISFSVALLDNEGTGIVVTSLHARSATRLFAKPVIKGEAQGYQFSKEEDMVIRKALSSK